MGIAPGVEDDARGLLGLRLVDPVDQLTLVVGLTEIHVELVASGGIARERLDVLQRGSAIGLRLARAEQVEVRAVEHKDDFRHRAAARGMPSPLYRQPPRKGKPGTAPGPCDWCAWSALKREAPALGSAGSASRLATTGHVDLFLEGREPDRTDHRLVADHVARRAVEPHGLCDLEA